jgi:hypothetical protein
LNIPAGWQIQITTWENDADDYQTNSVSGLQRKEDVYFYIDLASQFKDTNYSKGYGNKNQYASTIVFIVYETLAKNPNISSDVRLFWESEFDTITTGIEEDIEEFECEGDINEIVGNRLYELLCDTILGYPVNDNYASQERFCRVFDKFKVFYYNEPMSEVTHLFKA